MITAIDVGFGAVKGISSVRRVEYPSAVGNFSPIDYSTGITAEEQQETLCIEYEGKKYFLGSMAYSQSSPRVTMNSNRHTSKEGLALLLSAMVRLTSNQHENVELITGLPVNDYAKLQGNYKDVLLGKHYIQMLKPDGKDGQFYSFNVEKVKIIPQPVGTIFNVALGNDGQVFNEKIARSTVAVLDIGKCTVDLALAENLRFIQKDSTSYSDIGLFSAYKNLSKELKNFGYDIPPDKLEPYILSSKSITGLPELKNQVFTSLAEQIISRVFNTWTEMWNIDQIFVTGGGALLLGNYILKELDQAKVFICEKPSFTNVSGYFKLAQRMWGS